LANVRIARTIFQIALDQAMGMFEALRDGYCQLKFGIPFEALEKIEKAADVKTIDPSSSNITTSP
jgi:hypothetical protein